VSEERGAGGKDAFSGMNAESFDRHWLTLRFTGRHAVHESAFQAFYFDRCLPHIRFAVGVGVGVWLVFGILDRLLMPDAYQTPWVIRGVFGVLLAGVFGLSFTRWFRRIWKGCVAGATLGCGLGILGMIAMAPPAVSHVYYTGLILVLFFIYAFARLPFVWASAVGWTLLAGYEWLSLVLPHTTLDVFLTNNFFFVSAHILGMFACYTLEHQTRSTFALLVSLTEEQRRSEQAREELAAKVAELEAARENIDVLSGLIPICAHCKKVRDDQGYWEQVDLYIRKHAPVEFSHGICPDCLTKHYAAE
jgi:hypothetical protein